MTVGRRYPRTAVVAGLILSLLGVEAHSRAGHQGALAAPTFGCANANITVTPTTSSPTTLGSVVHVHVGGGLDKSAQVYIGLYDSANHPGHVTPLQLASVQSDGTYDGNVQLPGGGVSGGSDTLIVADNGPACVATPLTIAPGGTLTQSQGPTIGFSGYGFQGSSSLKISYVDSRGVTTDLTADGALSTGIYGNVTLIGFALPDGVATGGGTLTFTDGSSNSLTESFTYTGPVPPWNGTPGPTLTPNATQLAYLQGGGSNGNPGGNPGGGSTPVGTVGPYGTAVPGTFGPYSTPIATSTGYVPFPTSTPGGGSTGGNAPTPVGNAFPTATPNGGRPSPTAALIFPGATQTPRSGSTPAGSSPAFPTPTSVAGFPTPTAIGKGNVTVKPRPTPKATPRPALAYRAQLLNGSFGQHLQHWSASTAKAVTVVGGVPGVGAHVARITAGAGQVVLKQGFSYANGLRSVFFFYRNTGAMATAQIDTNGRVLVGRRLPVTHGNGYTGALLTLPAHLKPGLKLTFAFTVGRGTLYVADVVDTPFSTGKAPGAR